MKIVAMLMLLGIVFLAGCSANVKVIFSEAHVQAPEQIDKVMVLLSTYPTWKIEDREHFASKMASSLNEAGVSADYYVYSDTALNEGDVINDIMESFDAHYVLRIDQTHSRGTRVLPIVEFEFILTEREESNIIWKGIFVTETKMWGGPQTKLHQVGNDLPGKVMIELERKGFCTGNATGGGGEGNW